ncbi:hypothetical protein [Pseudonocardia sp. KRD291]|uniref:hypothetical protein n=1 Tax=Pseudonocardia sp. KRD291 TaxID=2792007 RepID=UPI001C4A3E61|nr:hypothetical protein [Pseudonocardia sp. KRD291]MBW0105318.1 hypothetical protein [Pseudonocardia sp. KRD291]
MPPWQAPRPGIVALAPLSGPDMLTGALRYIRSHWLVILVPSAVAMLVLTAVQVLLQFRLVSTLDVAGGGDPVEVTGPAFLTDVLLFGAVGLVLGLVVFPLVLSMLYSVLVPAVLGRAVPFGQALREGLRRAPALLGLQVVTALIGLVVVGVGIGLAVVIGVVGDGSGASILIAVLVGLAAYVAWIWISVTLMLAPPALVVERAGVGAALTRSRALVRGAWWRCFGILLLTAVAAAAAMGALIGIPTSLLGTGTMMSSISASPGRAPSASAFSAYFMILGIGTWLVSSVALPFGVGAVGLIYVDRRMRTEGYARELAAQAGIPGA